MEQEIQKESKQSDVEDYLNTETGDNEGSQALEPKEVVIASIGTKTHNKEDKKMDNPLIEILCKHPDKDEPIKLTSIKRLSGEKIIESALFVAVDDDKKFFKDSAIAYLLKFKGVKKLSDLEGKKIDTVKKSETSKYMALKCY